MPSAPYINLKQLLIQIQNTIRTSFAASYWVKGEVAGVRRIGSHIYFDLLELERGAKVAQIRACAFFGEGTLAVEGFEKVTGQKFKEGIKIGARVTVNFHPVYGLSLVLCEIDAELTLGGIELQRKETLKKLLAEHPNVIQFQDGGFITLNKQLPLPKVIQRIALVTSASSDAYSDFTHSLNANEYGYTFKTDLFNVLVQGYGAQSSLFDAFSKIRISGTTYDAVVLTRGGGAPADFLPFDDYHLALSLAQFPIPVITGIGHHTNQGICDFFARMHTKTPSMAAQFIIDHNHSFEKRIAQFAAGIQTGAARSFANRKSRFELLTPGLGQAARSLLYVKTQELERKAELSFSKATETLKRRTQELNNKQLYLNTRATGLLSSFKRGLDEKVLHISYTSRQILKEENQKCTGLGKQLSEALPRLIDQRNRSLNHLAELITQTSPERLLKRGYALIKKDGKILTDPESVQPGDQLELNTFSTIIQTEVKQTKKNDGREFNV